MQELAQWLALAPRPPALKPEQQWHIFISYRSTNRAWVLQLYDILRHLEYEVFVDQYVLAASDHLRNSLEQGLTRSAAGILVWSTHTRDSRWCQDEYHAMESLKQNQGFNYVVAILDKVELPLWAQKYIYIDFSGQPEGPRGADLLRLLYGLWGQPLPPDAVKLATSVDEEFKKNLRAIGGALNTGDYQRLVQFAQSDTLSWQNSPVLGCKAAEALIGLKRYDEALGVLETLMARFPKAIRPLQLKGLALAQKGNWREAQTILADLEAAGDQDPETLGIYARTWMDRYQESKLLNHLRYARDLYVKAFKQNPLDYYTGINAASKSLLLQELDVANQYAAEVEKLVGQEPVTDDYWKTATVAEVQLLRRNYDKAAQLYQAAVIMEPEAHSVHESSWLQAKRLMEVLKPAPEDWQKVAGVFEHLVKSTNS